MISLRERYRLGVSSGATARQQRASATRGGRANARGAHGVAGRQLAAPTDDAALEALDREVAQSVVFLEAGELADFLQEHLGQKLTAYLAGLKDAKAVGQWARGRAEPSAITRERLRAAYHVTALFTPVYGDRAAQAWFFGANSAFDDQAPAAVLRVAETPEEIARVVPAGRAFLRSAR